MTESTHLDNKTDSLYMVYSQFHSLKTCSLSFSYNCLQLRVMRLLEDSEAFWTSTNTSLFPERVVHMHEKLLQVILMMC